MDLQQKGSESAETGRGTVLHVCGCGFQGIFKSPKKKKATDGEDADVQEKER